MKDAFTEKDIVDYYEQTEVHYRHGWDLDQSLAMHYGYHRTAQDSFRQALKNMNTEMALAADIQATDRVLDAGCGIGGSSFFLAQEIGCRVLGITLSPLQVERALALREKLGLQATVDFAVMDYTQTSLPDASFDVIWALESFIHAPDKLAFFREAYRLLKPGGRVIIGDYIRKDSPLDDKEAELLKKWLDGIAATHMPSRAELEPQLKTAGFQSYDFRNITDAIRPSAWRQFYSSFYLYAVSWAYRIWNPKVRPFADRHYRVMYYQYLALKRKAWQYYFVRLTKA